MKLHESFPHEILINDLIAEKKITDVSELSDSANEFINDFNDAIDKVVAPFLNEDNQLNPEQEFDEAVIAKLERMSETAVNEIYASIGEDYTSAAEQKAQEEADAAAAQAAADAAAAAQAAVEAQKANDLAAAQAAADAAAAAQAAADAAAAISNQLTEAASKRTADAAAKRAAIQAAKAEVQAQAQAAADAAAAQQQQQAVPKKEGTMFGWWD